MDQSKLGQCWNIFYFTPSFIQQNVLSDSKFVLEQGGLNTKANRVKYSNYYNKVTAKCYRNTGNKE